VSPATDDSDPAARDALEAVVDAALERALVDGTHARRHFALAGALERVRRDSREPEVVGRARSKADRSRREVDSETRRGDSDPRAAAADPLAATLVCTVAVAALDVSSDDRIAPEAWIPGRGGPDEDLVAVGASLAHRRFDTDVDRLAARSGVSRQELSRRLRRE
jgi:hypothetical protein